MRKPQPTTAQLVARTYKRLSNLEGNTAGTHEYIGMVHKAVIDIARRLDVLSPIVTALDRVLHEKETLSKRLGTAQRQLAEANAYMARPAPVVSGASFPCTCGFVGAVKDRPARHAPGCPAGWEMLRNGACR